MADYELHADYNRNGRLDASSAEYDRRLVMPGAIVVPNLDADGRALPANVVPGSRIMLDGRQPIAPATDDEQLTLQVLVRRASAAAGTRFFLRPVGFPHQRLRFNDAQGRMLPRDLARESDLPIVLPSAPGWLELRLSTKTLPGSPIGHVTDLNARFSLNADDESTFTVQLISVDPAGRERQLDEARFTIAPFVILDHSATAQRAYIVDLGGSNEPSVIEMEAALRAVGVPMVRVPTSVTHDVWVQDQFQHALIQGPDGWRQVIVHLPRLRMDTSSGTTPVNLAQFVISHFPSRNVGLFDDLWERTLQIFDTHRRQHRIGFRECNNLSAEMERAFSLLNRLISQISALEPQFTIQDVNTWTDAMTRLPVLVERLSRLVTSARGNASAAWRDTLDGMRDDARTRWRALSARAGFNPATGVAAIPVSGSQIQVSADTANKLFVRVAQMRHSSNYGGNIEASPPTQGAPLGKLVIGNAVLGGGGEDDRDFMDPDVLRVLFKQGKQPVVQIDTTWLHVGHVDEVMTFAPNRSSPAGGGFALLEASPALAMALLRGARDRFFAGLSPADRGRYGNEPSGVLGRLTDLGASPVTRLHRGKVWTHRHQRPAGAEVPNILEPPLIYQRLSQAMNGGLSLTATSGGVNIHGIRYWPGEGPLRHYPADITVLELLFAELDSQNTSTNDHIAEHRMKSVADMLEVEFPQPRKLPLPVVFDRVTNVLAHFQTSAFTSNVVNMQVINGHLMVPRPYGPRMRVDDARAVITNAMRACDVPDSVARRIDARFIRRHSLNTGVYWIQRQAPISRPGGTPAPYSGMTTMHALYDGLETLDQVIDQFRDSFPGADAAALRRHIYDPNRRHFDASDKLLDGWRRFVIADDMIDMFEASILAVADELGVPVHWIDSWYYHVRMGEIHCGTNVLRVPMRGNALPNVWDVADTNAPSAMEFEGVEIPAPAGGGG